MTRDEMLISILGTIAQRSTCSRLSVGALVHREGRILTMGYNGAPAGLPHCIHSSLRPEPACEIAVHAEANCIAWAARWGLPLAGAEIMTSHSPCPNCCKLIINAGISSVKYQFPYRDLTSLQHLIAAGIEVQQL